MQLALEKLEDEIRRLELAWTILDEVWDDGKKQEFFEEYLLESRRKTEAFYSALSFLVQEIAEAQQSIL